MSIFPNPLVFGKDEKDKDNSQYLGFFITSRIFQHVNQLKLTANTPWDILNSLATFLNR